MKRTALYDEHVKLGGKIVEFAGWELPVQYGSIIKEHLATRNAAGLFDISHMGELSIQGPGASEFLQKVLPTRLNKIEPNKAMYSCLCNQQGGVIDDLFVYMISQESFLLVVNAANIEKNINWLNEHKSQHVSITDKSDTLSKIDIQGPRSRDILQKVLSGDFLDGLNRFSFGNIEYNSTDLMVSNSGYTGEIGYELYVPNENAVKLWRELLEAGSDFGIKPAGLGARDSLRIESCLSLYGHELTDDITPIEAGLRWLISSKEAYIGSDVLSQQKAEGVPRELIAFELTAKGVPREGYRIEKDSVDLGYVTSGIYSPLFEKGIGLALVQSGQISIGDTISVIIRKKPVPAAVVKRPFYQYKA